MTATDRDELAEVIGGHLPQSRGAGRWPGCFSHPRIEDWTPDHLADAILASDWLAQRDRRAAAEALEKIAREWQFGGWMALNAPVPAGAIPALARGQIVTDWLRASAGRIARGES